MRFIKDKVTLIIFVLAIMSGSTTLLGDDSKLLVNPSMHIIVNDKIDIPESGTYEFDTKIFKVRDHSNTAIADVDQRITKALEIELGKKGFKLNSEKPDILVNYAVAADSSITTNDFKYAYVDDSAFILPEFEKGKELKYNEGALIIDIVDAKSKKLLWRGAIMAELNVAATDYEKDKRVRLALKLLLNNFPRPPKECLDQNNCIIHPHK